MKGGYPWFCHPRPDRPVLTWACPHGDRTSPTPDKPDKQPSSMSHEISRGVGSRFACVIGSGRRSSPAYQPCSGRCRSGVLPPRVQLAGACEIFVCDLQVACDQRFSAHEAARRPSPPSTRACWACSGARQIRSRATGSHQPGPRILGAAGGPHLDPARHPQCRHLRRRTDPSRAPASNRPVLGYRIATPAEGSNAQRSARAAIVLPRRRRAVWSRVLLPLRWRWP
jgi:hypothetical protein